MMESDDSSVPVRKAFSAENAKDDSSSSDLQHNRDDRKSKTCASASYSSARRKYMQERHLQNILSEDFSSQKLRPDVREDQKLFLNASQILEKLSKAITKLSEASQLVGTGEIPSTQSRRTTFREIVLYREVLKRLLEERCILVLEEESDVCIKRTIKLINDFKHLYIKEKSKLTMMPIQACNRFISSNDISVSTLELLVKKLQIICDLHLSIRSSYQKIINCFYASLDLELYQMVSKTNRQLSKYKSSLFHWAFKCMNVLMQKLCLADPNSVSPDFLQSILESCKIFNTLIKNNKEVRHRHVKKHDLFSTHVSSTECKEVPFSLILNYLAYYEAKIASERVVHFLTSACKKHRQTNLKKKNNKKTPGNECGTSDYHSASTSDMNSEKSTLKRTDLADANKNFLNLLLSITQRNQSLILKYVYAIANLSNLSCRRARRLSSDSNSSITSVRQMWNVPDPTFQSNSSIHLEELFWFQFWSHVQLFILKILCEVPYHQYGDSVAGTIQLWPHTYVETLLECLKASAVNDDLTEEGKYTMKQIYEYILVHKLHASWDNEFLLALSSTFSHRFSLVPASPNQVKTLPGSLFYTCIDVLLGVLDADFQNMNSILFLKCLHRLHVTLDAFILWMSYKARAVFASRDMSKYLMISWSDCKSATKLLQSKTSGLVESSDSFMRIPALRLQKEKILWRQMDVLLGFEREAPDLVHQFFFSALREDLLQAAREHSGNTCACFGRKCLGLGSMEDLFCSLSEVVKLSDPIPILTAISTAVATAFLSALHRQRESRNAKLVRFLEQEFSGFCRWLDSLYVAQDEKLRNLPCLRKVEAVFKCIQEPASRSSVFPTRLNRVVPTADTGLQAHEDVLSNQEKEFWKSRNLFPFCL